MPTERALRASRPRSRQQRRVVADPRWMPGRGMLAVLAVLAGTAGFAASGIDGLRSDIGQREAARSIQQRPASPLEAVTDPGLRPHAGEAGGAADPNAEAVLPRTHTVEAGDTFARIAARYDLPLDRLLRANAALRSQGLNPGQVVVLPEPRARRPASPEAATTAGLPVEGILEDSAAAHDRDPALIKAVAWQESQWNQRLISPAGAIGLMQVRPTSGEVAATLVGRPLDLHDPVDNVTAGVAYLDMLVARHDGDVRAALAAYFQGAHSVRTDGRFAVTERYVAEVTALRDRFADLSSPDRAGEPLRHPPRRE